MKEVSEELFVKCIKQAVVILEMHGEIAGSRVCQDWSGSAKDNPEAVFTEDELDVITYHYEMHNSLLSDYEEGVSYMDDEMVASFAIAQMLRLMIKDKE